MIITMSNMIKIDCMIIEVKILGTHITRHPVSDAMALLIDGCMWTCQVAYRVLKEREV